MNPPSCQIPWRWLALFYAVALLIALPFNLGWFASWFGTHLHGTPLARWPFLPAALGPALGAILARRLGPQPPQETSLFGTSVPRTIVAGLLPVAVFSFLGLRTGLYALIAVVYATGEELGWRGFLADTLAPLRWQWRLLLTSALWWFWHLRLATTFDLLVFPLIILASSLVLGHAARVSGSVLVPASMHALIILLSASGPPSRPMLFAGVATLVSWSLLGSLWPHPRPQAAPSAGAV